MVETSKYYVLTLDPVHIGEGGYRLGMVDNTIVREPATEVPKIPGTSLAGTIKEYATLYFAEKAPECSAEQDKKKKREKAVKIIEEYFGTGNKQGMLRFYDAEILLFPVASINGTVWITTKSLLEKWFINNDGAGNGTAIEIPEEAGKNNKAYIVKWDNGEEPDKTINLGWLLLDIYKNGTNETNISINNEITKYAKRIVIVSDRLFSKIINDNLEVRTSVRINPETGTAAEGALFTYEAIPRGTIMAFEMYKDLRRCVGADLNNIDGAIEEAFKFLELLGVGGMGTRGFGRIKKLHQIGGQPDNNQNDTQQASEKEDGETA